MRYVPAVLIVGIVLALSAPQADAGWMWEHGDWVYVGPDSQVYIVTSKSADESSGETEAAPQEKGAPAPPKAARAPAPADAERKQSAPASGPAVAAAPAKETPAKKPEPKAEKKPAPKAGKPPEPKAEPAPAARTGQGEAASAEAPDAQPPFAGDGVEVKPAVFRVGAFVVQYVLGGQGLPDPAEVLEVEVALRQADDTYTAPAPGEAVERRPLKAWGGDPPAAFTAAALFRVNERIVDFFNSRDIYGVFITPHQRDIEQVYERDAAGRPVGVEFVDRRPKDQTDLRILVFVGRVADVRTLAAGDRIPDDARVNHPAHQRILRDSPVQPRADDGTGGLLHKEKLDEYAMFLSRHPGRDVAVSVARSDKPAEVTLDYHVTESKPWVVYHETSNTGTRETGEWRSRFGFIDNQVTGHDDILALDYVTAQFDTTHAATASYEAPILGLERVRYAVHGAYTEFTATDVGLPGLTDEDFRGKAWWAGADLFVNFFQHKDLFVDFLTGIRWQHERILNLVADIDADSDMWLPSVGFRVQRTNDLEDFRGVIRLHWLDEKVADTDRSDLERFGRFNPDTDWVVVRWNVSETFFLEPLLNREAWQDVNTPGSSTLAHEVALEFRGQHALGHRLIPSAEATVGGVYSVRGYPESVIAGDTVYVASMEYRYHVPRALRPGGSFSTPREPLRILGQPFRFRPQHVYGMTDWDFVLKGFFDVGKTVCHDRLPLPLEDNRLLMGTGVGFELRLLRNLAVQLDYGVALRGIDEREVDAGDQRVHLIATLSF